MQPVKYTHIDITIFKTKSPRGGVLNSIVSVQTWWIKERVKGQSFWQKHSISFLNCGKFIWSMTLCVLLFWQMRLMNVALYGESDVDKQKISWKPLTFVAREGNNCLFTNSQEIHVF